MKDKKKSPAPIHCSTIVNIALCFLLFCTVSCHRKPTLRTAKVISECTSDNGSFKSSWSWLEQESLPPLLSSVTQSQNGNIYTKDMYEYNDQQLVRIHKDLSYSSPVEVVFSYDNRGRVISQTLNDNDGVLGKATYTYNDRDQIVSAAYQLDDEFTKRQHAVAPWRQASHRAMIQRLSKIKQGSKGYLNIRVDYVYESGNVVSETWDYDGETQTIHYTYDNAVNPFHGLWMLDEELVLYPDQLSTNNVLTTTYYEDGDIDSESNIYLYDEENYPIAITQTVFPSDTIFWKYKNIQYKVSDPK